MATMSVNHVEPSRKSKNVIVFDQRAEQKITRDASTKIKDVAKIMNESGFDIIKCVPSEYDDDAKKLFPVSEENKRNFLVIELAMDEDKDKTLQVKKFEAFLKARKYTVVAKKEYETDDYPSCKVIVKLS